MSIRNHLKSLRINGRTLSNRHSNRGISAAFPKQSLGDQFFRRISLDNFFYASILNHMVKHSSEVLDATFSALSDATRRGILARLTLGEASVSELAAPYRMSLPAVSKHLRVLEGAGLVERQKDGRVHRCRLVAEPMKGASDWIERYRRFWEQQFNALERYLAVTQEPAQEKEKQQWQTPHPAPHFRSRSGASSRRRAKKSGPHGRNAKG
jgi:DNA-binding transcriptional ArsR family regulator